MLDKARVEGVLKWLAERTGWNGKVIANVEYIIPTAEFRTIVGDLDSELSELSLVHSWPHPADCERTVLTFTKAAVEIVRASKPPKPPRQDIRNDRTGRVLRPRIQDINDMLPFYLSELNSRDQDTVRGAKMHLARLVEYRSKDLPSDTRTLIIQRLMEVSESERRHCADP